MQMASKYLKYLHQFLRKYRRNASNIYTHFFPNLGFEGFRVTWKLKFLAKTYLFLCKVNNDSVRFLQDSIFTYQKLNSIRLVYVYDDFIFPGHLYVYAEPTISSAIFAVYISTIALIALTVTTQRKIAFRIQFYFISHSRRCLTDLTNLNFAAFCFLLNVNVIYKHTCVTM